MPTRRALRLLLAVAILLNASFVTACLWDSDTRSMEEQAFPDALALITGGFLRHSPEFYEWRIEDRLQRIEKNPDLFELYDDLAVAYEKTGQTGKAIEVMQGIESRDPDRYETLANLGTFYIHNGELERGVDYIDRALEVNPEAHFGRERYQKYVVEYVLSKQVDGEMSLPLDAESNRERHATPVDFAEFLLTRLELIPDENEGRVNDKLKQQHDAEVKKAIKGILGMMRFGNHDSPILLECLGDLLVHGEEWDSNRHLAARAYLKASYAVEDNGVKQKYRDMAKEPAYSIYSPKDGGKLEFSELEKRFREEIETADTWTQKVFEDERRWIAEGLDVERKYAEVYYDDPQPLVDEEEEHAGQVLSARSKIKSFSQRLMWFIGFFGVVVVLVFFFLVKLLRRYFVSPKLNVESQD